MGKLFSFEIIRNLMKITIWGLLAVCVLFTLVFAFSQVLSPDTQVKAAQIFAPPIYNWFVCEDLGVGSVPGVPDLRQILRLCHNQGWEIRTYCLQPGIPAPPIGSTCSQPAEGNFWCGDEFQLLQEFALDVTPTASPNPSVTNTRIPSQTSPPPLNTQTPTWTPTGTQTPTSTVLSSDTPPPTSTPRLTQTPTRTNTPAPSTTGTVVNSETPMVSSTPPITLTETPQTSRTNTPVGPTETFTLTPPPPPISETPTATLSLFTPVSTERPRPGGDGNFHEIGLLGIFLGILTSAIGFLSFLILQNNGNEIRMSIELEESTFPSMLKSIILPKRLLILILLSLMILTAYQIPQYWVGLPQPVSGYGVSHVEYKTSKTPTPFQPQHPTPVFSLEIEPISSLTYEFRDVDFSPQSGWRTITIDPPSQRVNDGKPITLSFLLSETCDFGDQHACVSSHVTEMGNLTFLSIHSGYGGEGQSFRHALEGTGINTTAFSLATVQKNLDVLRGAQVSISEDGNEKGGFIVKGVIRIPARDLETYFSLPIEEALVLAGSINPTVWAFIDPNQPILIFETCGWKMPVEIGSNRVQNTTGSVYVVIIQPTP